MFFNTIPIPGIMLIFTALLAIYAILQRTNRTLMLLYVTLLSLFLFTRMNPQAAALLPLTALISWAMTKRMGECSNALRKRWMWATVTAELLPLLYFKYAGPCIATFSSLLEQNFPLTDIILPVGISFYTFQAISHTVDVYRGNMKQQMDFLEYTFYLSFFPLLLAGPITRANTMLQQIRQNSPVNPRLLYTGLWLLTLGILKKCVVADYIAQFNNWAFDEPLLYGGFELLMAVIGFSVQIYCDFSGYSDMSIGVAAMMGFRLSENFNFPYQSLNVSEFWHRWHISLSTWFRDYVYIPLGGNRVSLPRTYFNNLITMLLAGLWHGSTLMFLLWGVMHGLALVIYKGYRTILPPPHHRKRWWQTLTSWLIFQCFLLFTWIFFRAADMNTALIIIRRIFTEFSTDCIPAFLAQRPLWILLIILFSAVHCIRERWFYRIQERFVTLPWPIKALILLIVLQLAIELNGSEVQPFLYYKF